jgi:predicted acylesterase/phospholipase RssA
VPHSEQEQTLPTAVVVLQAAVPEAPSNIDAAQRQATARAEKIKEAAPDARHQEVRVAMAWNGGVSLAVWMGGVAVELDAARRAHLGPDTGRGGAASSTLYHAMCAAFDRSLVIDILSGASAGGLNGALLAAAIRKGRRLPPSLLRREWIDIGDFLGLLQPMSRRDPPSLMRGGSSIDDQGVFYKSLRPMFAAILDTDEAEDEERIACNSPQPIKPLDVALDVMMTNVYGEPRRFLDVWGFELAAREYRSPLHFRQDGHFTVDNLAAAARASASFPVAFEPFKVEGDAAGLASLPASRYAIDGGLLENAPIDAAIRLVPTRPAHTEVKRFVCYLNAAPPSVKPTEKDTKAQPQPQPAPRLANVLGYVFNLPRDARFVDQLYAVSAASRRAAAASIAQPELLKTPWPALEATALALLPTYRSRRCVLTLEELLDDPVNAQRAFATVSPGAALNWLPVDLEVPADGAGWRWGIRPAERILHLELDLLRNALAVAPDDVARKELLATRIEIDAALAKLDTYRASVVQLVRSAIAADVDAPRAIRGADLMVRSDVFSALLDATRAFIKAVEAGKLGSLRDPATVGASILDAQHRENRPQPAAWIRHRRTADSAPGGSVERFLRRALATEVIRRAFSTEEDIEPSQTLLFAQITPLAPTQLFTARPFDPRSAPDSGDDKLTGILLMHFSGFYRRSWRANDYMWGRLDGATRIVDLLIDSERAQRVAKEAGAAISESESAEKHPAVILCDALLPADAPADARHALVEEAFRDACRPDAPVSETIKTALNNYAASREIRTHGTDPLGTTKREVEELRRDLLTALEADLDVPDGDALFTRTICARALQLEIFREESGELVKETVKDKTLGSFTAPLTLSSDPANAISTIRSQYSDNGSLPRTLGRGDPDEATSDLAMETISHTGYVSLAALRGVNAVLGNIVAVARAPLLPISGIASRRLVRGIPLDRIAVFLGLAAAAAYIAARISTTDKTKAPLGALWSPPVLLSWIALFAIAGAALVPLIRAIRTKQGVRHITQGLAAFALLAASVGLAVALAKWRGGHGYAEIAATPGSYGLPAWLMWLTFLTILGAPVVLRLPFVPTPIKTRLQPLADKIPLTWAVGIPVALVAIWSSIKLAGIISIHTWQGAVAISAFASMAIVGIYLLIGGRR